MAIQISAEELRTLHLAGYSRKDMAAKFDCSLAHIKRELARSAVNLTEMISANADLPRRRKMTLYDPFAESDEDYENDFDPDSVEMKDIDPKQLTPFELAKLKLGDRLVEKSTGYFIDRTPVSVEGIFAAAAICN